MVQTFPAHAPKEPFAHRIHQRGAVRSAHVLDPRCSEDTGEERPIFTVIVGDEMLGMVTKRRRLAELLGDPRIAGMARDAHVYDAARGQFDHKERVEGTKEEVSDGQEVRGPDIVRVIV